MCEKKTAEVAVLRKRDRGREIKVKSMHSGTQPPADGENQDEMIY